MTPFAPILGCTPAYLQNMGMTGLLVRRAATKLRQSAPPACPAEASGERGSAPELVVPPSSGPESPASAIQQPVSPPLASTPSEIQNRTSKIRRPRNKACRLPADARLTLNTMLAGGCRYRDIIHSLNSQGYPGFNKVNLNAWKRTGFQDWLRSQDAGCLVTDRPVLETGSNR